MVDVLEEGGAWRERAESGKGGTLNGGTSYNVTCDRNRFVDLHAREDTTVPEFINLITWSPTGLKEKTMISLVKET